LEQREAFAAWIVQRLSGWMRHEEMVKVLVRARRLADNQTENAPPPGARIVEAPKRGRGKPGKWRSASGIQMVAEIENLMLGTGKAEEEVIEMIWEVWRRRFPRESNANLRRGYATAREWRGVLDEGDE
jgi:hypothetical protein